MREDILKNIEGMLSKITEIPQPISEDMALSGMAENKPEACSLELASWLAEIEAEYDIEIPADVLTVSDIIDKAVQQEKVNKNEF